MKPLISRILNLLDLLIFGRPIKPHWIAPQSLPYHPLYFAGIEMYALIKFRKDLWTCAICDTNAGKQGSTAVRFSELVNEYLTPHAIKAMTKKYIDDYTNTNLWIVCEYTELSFYQLMHTGECKTQSVYEWVSEIRRKYDNIELARLYQN